MLLDSNHDGPTAAVETLVIINNAAAAGATATAGIQHHVDDLEGDHPLPPLIVDYNNSDYDFEITKFACDLDKIYGGLDVKRGKADNYFGV